MEDPHYLGSHVEQRLAEDPRTSELGIRVTIEGQRAVLHGTVATAERRERVEQVAREALPDHEVVNEVLLSEPVEPPRGNEHVEVLP